MTKKDFAFATKVIHGKHVKNSKSALAPPIYQTSTFVFDNAFQGGERFAGRDNGFMYSRIGNPTVRLLEEKIAYLEEGEECTAFSSGMGAISGTVLSLLNKGDHLLSDMTLYGCTFSLFNEKLRKLGIDVEFIDFSDLSHVEKSLRSDTKMVYFETPANPNMKIIDIKKVAELVHKTAPSCLVVVDNTFATPAITKPLNLGADIVVHSATKYLNGHGDVVAGLSISNHVNAITIRSVGLKDLTGAVLSPNDAYLILRGLKTLNLRINAHCQNAMDVAKYLDNSKYVKKVYYPGLIHHSGHHIAKQQMAKFGAMISFEVKSYEIAKKVLDNLKLCVLAVSLGDCETLIQHPASMTHSMYTKEELEAAGFSERLIRISVGLEDPQDIIKDLEQALEKAYK